MSRKTALPMAARALLITPALCHAEQRAGRVDKPIAQLYSRAMQSAEITRAGELAGALDERLAAVWRLLLRHSNRTLSRTAISVLALLRDRGPQRITTLAAAES